MPRTVLAITLSAAFSAGALSETLLIADKSSDALLYFDTASLEVTRTVPVGGNPHEVVVTRGGRYAITSNSRSNTISIVDLAKGEEVDRLASPRFQYPHGMALHPNGLWLYLTNEQTERIFTIDLEERRIVDEVSTGMGGSHMVVLTADGARAYIANREAGTVSLWKTASPKSIVHAEAGTGAEGIALSHDERWLLVANRNDNDLHLFDASDLSLEAKIALGEGPVRVAVAPDDRHAFVTHRASAQVYVIDLSARKVTAKIAVGEGPGGMAFDVAGTRLFVANTSAGTVSVLDLETLTLIAKSSKHENAKQPHWAQARSSCWGTRSPPL